MKKAMAVVATALLLGGCNTPFTPDGVSGTYNLLTASGATLPVTVTVTDGGQQFDLTFQSGSVTLRADGTYTLSVTQSFDAGGQTQTDTHTESGTFTLTEPTTITITSSTGDVLSGNLAGGLLTVNVDVENLVVVFVFERV